MDVISRFGFGKDFGYLEPETDLYSFLKSAKDLWPRLLTSADVPLDPQRALPPFFLELLGPKQDKTKSRALMVRWTPAHVSTNHTTPFPSAQAPTDKGRLACRMG